MLKELIYLLIFLLFLSCSSKKQNYNVIVPMRDGINLSTTILFPEEEQNKYPVVFVRTPYNKEMRIEEYRYILENGYVLAIQDVRGRFESEGKFEPYINEAKDGYDAIEWIADQTWCDGNIGNIWFASSNKGVFRYDGETIANGAETKELGGKLCVKHSTNYVSRRLWRVIIILHDQKYP